MSTLIVGEVNSYGPGALPEGAPGTSEDNPNYVISALLLDGAVELDKLDLYKKSAEELEVLGGVRVGKDENDPDKEFDSRHQEVFSSITTSVDEPVFTAIFGDPSRWEPNVVQDLYDPRDPQRYLIGHGEQSIGALAIEGMLGNTELGGNNKNKLGLQDAIAAGTFRGMAEVSCGLVRWVPDASTRQPLYEFMGCFIIGNLTGADAIPEKTHAYDPIVWATATSVVEAFYGRSALLLQTRKGRIPFMTCAGVGGSCMRLVVHTLENRFGIEWPPGATPPPEV